MAKEAPERKDLGKKKHQSERTSAKQSDHIVQTPTGTEAASYDPVRWSIESNTTMVIVAGVNVHMTELNNNNNVFERGNVRTAPAAALGRTKKEEGKKKEGTKENIPVQEKNQVPGHGKPFKHEMKKEEGTKENILGQGKNQVPGHGKPSKHETKKEEKKKREETKENIPAQGKNQVPGHGKPSKHEMKKEEEKKKGGMKENIPAQGEEPGPGHGKPSKHEKHACEEGKKKVLNQRKNDV